MQNPSNIKVAITFRQMEPTEALKEFVHEKIKRLDNFVLKPTDVHVFLSVERYLHKAEINVHDVHLAAHGEQSSDDMYISIEKAIDKVGKVLRKHKEKVKDKIKEAKTAPPSSFGE